jgi:hypothetical protein
MRKFELAVTKGNTTLKLGVFDSYDEAVEFLYHLPNPEGVSIQVLEVGQVSLALRAYDKYKAFVGLDD